MIRAIDDTWQALWDRGYPHMRLITPAVDKKTATKTVKAALNQIDPEHCALSFPDNIVAQYLRSLRADVLSDDTSPYTTEEATTLIGTLNTPKAFAYGFEVDNAVYLIEQVLGGAFTVDTILASFERRTPADWLKNNQSSSQEMTRTLYYLLRRTDVPGARERIAELMKTKMDPYLLKQWQAYFGDGEPHIRRAHAQSADTIMALLAEDPDAYDATDGGYLGTAGDALLAHWLAHETLKTAPAWRHATLAQLLTSLAPSPLVRACMEVLLEKKRAAPIAEAWLAANGGTEKKAAKPRTKAAVEKDFDKLATQIAKDLYKVRGDAAQERALLKEANERFIVLATELGLDPTLTRLDFFGIDGVAYEKEREPPLFRKFSEEECARYMDMLTEL